MILKSINPFTNGVIEEFEEISGETAEKLLTESGVQNSRIHNAVCNSLMRNIQNMILSQ
jgi:hypothetical protein